MQPRQDRACLRAEPRDVHPEAGPLRGGQVGQAAAELVHRAPVVAAPQVVEPDANLQDALVEVADRVRLRPPDVLQSLVALPVFPGVELGDAREQGGRRRLAAPRRAPRRLLLDDRQRGFRRLVS